MNTELTALADRLKVVRWRLNAAAIYQDSREVGDIEAALRQHAERGGELQHLENECLDLRCVESRGFDDSEVLWEVVEHHMTPPRERVIGIGKTPSEAIAQSKLPEGHPDRWDYVPPFTPPTE